MRLAKALWSLWLIALLPSGVGSLRAVQIQICTEDSFVPNYISQLDALIRWREFPIRLYFVRDEHYTSKRQQLAIEGFQQWVRLTDEKIRFVLTNDEQEAQVRVRFDPSTAAGRTDCSYYPERRELDKVEIVIGVRGDVPANIQSVSVHEFGHALGIVGHSDDPKDAMYPRYTLGVSARLSQRDLNVIKTVYCELFEGGRVLPMEERTRGLPSSRDLPRKIRIVCDRQTKDR